MLAEKLIASEDLIGKSRDLVEAFIKSLISGIELDSSLKKAIEYSLFPGGKRIRPVFALMLFHDCGGAIEHLVPAAAALELIHTSTLIHDDLPALDNDDMRRGRPSLHRAFGEATAILAGDTLVPLAFSALTRSQFKAETISRFVSALSSGYVNVCHGQQLDLLPRTDKDNSIDLFTLHRLKTGSLFQVAAEFAAIALQKPDPVVSLFSTLGNTVGVYFQIVDDLIDAFGSDSQRGRVGSSDARSHRYTFFTQSISDDRGSGTPLLKAAGLNSLRAYRATLDESFNCLELALGVDLKFARLVVDLVDKTVEGITA